MSARGVNFLNYINPHFINSPDSDLYVFGEEKGYFVKNKTTGETLLQNFGFDPFKENAVAKFPALFGLKTKGGPSGRGAN